jgi:phage terminase large subunit
MNSNDLFSPVYNNAFRELEKGNYKEFMFYGGRGSAKSSVISLMIAYLLLTNPDVHALCLRKKDNTLRDSVFDQMQWACDMLELNYKATVSPMRIETQGQRILFKGVKDHRNIKSIKTKTGYIGVLWFEELTEFTPAEVRSITQSVGRGGHKFWIFYSFNPPTNRDNWCNKEVLINKPKRLILKTNYKDIRKSWLGDKFIEDAEWLKKTNERLYLNEYMGETTGTGLDVFENLKEWDGDGSGFDYYFHGVDWGYYPDPWAYVGMAYKPSTRELFIFDELHAYKKGNDATSELLFEHITSRTWEFYNHEKPKHPSELNVLLSADIAEPKSISDYINYGWRMNKPKKHRDYSFKWLQSLTAIHINKELCPRTWEEFYGYHYEVNKDGDIISTYPEGQKDHHIDCVRYAMAQVYKRGGE